MKKTVIISFVCFLSLLAHAGGTRVGVYVTGQLAENYNMLLGDKLVEAFSESEEYIAVNRSSALNNIVKQVHSYQRSGNIDYTEVVNAMKQSGESQLCAINVYEVDNMYVFSSSLIDVLTNTVIKTASSECIQSEISYTKIVEIAGRLSSRMMPNIPRSTFDLQSVQRKSEIDLAKQKVEENKKYNISYAAFKYEENNLVKGNSAAHYYLRESDNIISVGHWLWFIPPITTVVVGLGVGLTDLNELNNKKALIIVASAVGSMLPSFSCYIAGAAYRRQAWKAYRQPYDNALKEYENAKKEKMTNDVITFQVSPAIGYDWAGAQIKIAF